MTTQEKTKTHYRKVFKSDHLGVADLEELLETKNSLIFTIDHVYQEYGVRVAGSKGDHNIAYFKEDIKPWVVNAGNCKILKSFANGSPNVEDWSNITIQLYIDPNVKMKGDIVGGVRINPKPPVLQKQDLLPDTQNWTNAVAAYERDGNLDAVKKRMTISPENEAKIKAECTKEAENVD